MTDPSTLLEMDLPDEVADAAIKAYQVAPEWNHPFHRVGFKAAIRAALQAMLDGGRARTALACQFSLGKEWEANTTRQVENPDYFPVLIIRLTSDEQKDG